MSFLNLPSIKIGSLVFLGNYSPQSLIKQAYQGIKYSQVSVYLGRGLIMGFRRDPVLLSNYLKSNLWWGEILNPGLPEDLLIDFAQDFKENLSNLNFDTHIIKCLEKKGVVFSFANHGLKALYDRFKQT